MRALLVVIIGPFRDLCPGMIEAEEQALIQKFVPHPTVEAFAECVLHGLARCDEAPDDLVLLRHVRKPSQDRKSRFMVQVSEQRLSDPHNTILRLYSETHRRAVSHCKRGNFGRDRAG